MSKSRWGGEMDALIALVRGITAKTITSADYTDVTWASLTRTIVRTSGSWVADGYIRGYRFSTSATGGGGANDGDFTPETVTVLTLTLEESIVSEVSTTTGIFTREGIDLPAGAAGAERGLRQSTDLQEGEIPHLFVHSPALQENVLEFRQAEIRNTYQLELWLLDTQENAAEKVEMIRAHIDNDRTLGGLVDDCRFTNAKILESADSLDRRVAEIEVETFTEAG